MIFHYFPDLFFTFISEFHCDKRFSIIYGILLESNVYRAPFEYSETWIAAGIEPVPGDDHEFSSEHNSFNFSEKAVIYQCCPVNES